MRRIPALILLFASTLALRAGEVVLPYPAFGPQAAAHELIGMEWWQWESQGDGPATRHPIKVVVFWDQTLESTKEKYPVDRQHLKDFRYVEYSKAIEHMEKTAKELKSASLDAAEVEMALARLKNLKSLQ